MQLFKDWKTPPMKTKQNYKRKKPKNQVSPLKRPEHLSLEEWQIALRRQIGQDSSLRLKNMGNHPVFSDFEVRNVKTSKAYRVAIRGEMLGINYCSCPDFEVNTLGTCKHVEGVLSKLRKDKTAREALKKPFVSDHSSVTLRYGLQRRVYLSLGRSASLELKEIAPHYFDVEGYLTPEGFNRFNVFMEAVKTLKDEVRFHPDAMAFVAKVRDAEHQRMRITKTASKEDGKFWRNLIKTDLYPYQKEGVLFAAKAGRCLIADEMGLGKTLQAIAAAELMARVYGIEKVLVVCPSSLKYQWKQEIEKFADRTAQVIQGLWHLRQSQYEAPAFFKIVNYDVIHRDLAAIGKWAPDLVILDEAQRIKNWKTRLAKSVKQLSSPYAIVLTGTPLENRLEELHSIVEFIDRHHLGPLFRFLAAHQIIDPFGKMVGYKDLHRLGKTLESILIRRSKKEVLTQLPERMDKNYFVKLTQEQRQIHEENREIAARIIHKWQKYHFLSDEDQQRLMMALQNMRMVCDNTYLLDQQTIKGRKIDELEILLREIFENPKNKAVIFSQWIRMGELVNTMFKVNNWKYVYLHGGVPSSKRGDLIKTFKDDPECRIFLSTDAGGTGLNLQQASVVINLDLPWNPAVLEQRIGRVHRLGQERAVQVINFVAEDSIEQGMLSLYRFKKSMFAGVLDGGQSEVFMEGGRLNKFMKTVESVTSSLKPHIPTDSGIEAAETEKEEKTAQEEIGQEETPSSGDKLSFQTQPSLQPINDLIKSGIAWLSKMSEQVEKSTNSSGNAPAENTLFTIRRDSETGKQTLQIPLPDEKTIALLCQTFSEIFSSFSDQQKR